MRKIMLILGILLLIQITAAFTITSESGETWIKYSWDSYDPITITIDGGAINESVNNQGYFILSGINPSEVHNIVLYNSTTGVQIGTHEATTTPAMNTIYVLLGISILFTVLLMLMRDDIRGIICGIIGGLTGMYIAQIGWFTINGIWALGLILGVINIGVIGLVIYERFGKKPDSWGLDDDE